MIVDGMRNQNAVQHPDVSFASTKAAGDGCIITHTNGNVYSIFARNVNTGGVVERRLYMGISSDQANTWPTIVQLTSGTWDDQPTAIQLDTTDTDSLIGVVYVSNSVLKRFTVNTSGVLQSPRDQLFALTQFNCPQLVETAGGFAVFMATTLPSSVVFFSTNVVFTDNAWSAPTEVNPQPLLGSTTNSIVDMSVKMLPTINTLCMLVCARTALDGADVAGMGNAIASTVRYDLFATFSSDGGATWSFSPQNLTNYTGTPQFDLQGIQSAISSDLAILPTGDIAITFQEATSPQMLSTDSSPLLTPAGGTRFCSGLVYIPSRKLIIMAIDGTFFPASGGLYVYDLINETRTSIQTSSTPALWTTNIQSIALDSTETWLAVAENGSLDILNISDPDVTNWTVTGLRMASTPPLDTDNVLKVAFLPSSTELVASYSGTGNVSGKWGFTTDAASPTVVTSFAFPNANYGTVKNFIVRAGDLVIFGINHVSSVSPVDGSVNWNFAAGGAYTFGSIFYDDVNSQVWVGGAFSVTGSTFDQGYWPVSSFGLGSPWLTPASVHAGSAAGNTLVSGGADYNILFPGKGIMLRANNSGVDTTDFYSFTEQTFYGPIYLVNQQQANEFFTQSPPEYPPASLLDSRWLSLPGFGGTGFMDTLKLGRLRWGVFGYNAGTNSLITSGVNFYDLLNPILQDTTLNNLRRVSITCDSQGDIYALMSRFDLNRTQQFSAMLNGFVGTDAHLLKIGCSILNRVTNTVDVRSRILNLTTRPLTARGRVVYASYMSAKAHIIPFKTVTMQSRARVANYHLGDMPGYYEIANAQSGDVRGLYYYEGTVSRQGFGSGAMIAGQFSGSLKAQYGLTFKPTGKLSFAITAPNQQFLGSRAFIQR